MAEENNRNPKEESSRNPKEEKKKKRRKSGAAGKIILILLLIIAVLVAILYFDPFGFGTGGFGLKGNGNGNNAAAPAQTTQSTASADAEQTTSVTEKAVEQAPVDMQITINGATYLYNGNEVTIQNILDEAGKHDNNVKITIIDSSATVNAVEDLKKVLDENKLAYVM